MVPVVTGVGVFDDSFQDTYLFSKLEGFRFSQVHQRSYELDVGFVTYVEGALQLSYETLSTVG